MKVKGLVLTAMLAVCMMGTKAQTDSLKRNAQIELLFNLLNMEQSCYQSAKVAAEQTIAGTPRLANKKEETLAFFVKYAGYASLKNDLVKIYAKYYTAEEIDDMVKFYKTSAGRKSIGLGGTLAQETMAATAQRLQDNESELSKLLSQE